MKSYYSRALDYPNNARKRCLTILLSVILVFFFFLVFTYSSAVAQEATKWSSFEHVPGYSDDAFPPFLIADQNKTVHAFSSQQIGSDQFQAAVFYRQWTLAGDWTNPVDIILPPAGEVKISSAFLDQSGKIHLIYQATDQGVVKIYYSWGPATNAARATSWSSPIAVGESAISPSSGSISGDEDGNLTIIYNGNRDGNGVYAFYSSDAGLTWSEPQPIFLTLDGSLIPFSLQLSRGREEQLHGTWNVVSSLGVDEFLYYMRQDIASQVWTGPILLDERVEGEGFFGPSFPVIVDNGEKVVIMYNGGSQARAGSVDVGRPVQRVQESFDNGESWSDAIEPFPLLQGRSGSHALAVDSNGIIHALFIQRIDRSIDGQYEPIGGMWHSELGDRSWSEPERVVMGRSGHDLSAVISQGNTLLVTMREDPGVGNSGVWSSYKKLDVPELPLLDVPTLESVPVAAATRPLAEAVPTLIASNEAVTIVPVAVSEGENNATTLLFMGLAPVFIILAAVILLHRFIQSYRR